MIRGFQYFMLACFLSTGALSLPINAQGHRVEQGNSSPGNRQGNSSPGHNRQENSSPGNRQGNSSPGHNRQDYNDYRSPNSNRAPINKRPPRHDGYRPDNNNRYEYNNSSPGHRPYHSGHYCPPPMRPYRPNYRPIPRPVCPLGYRPYYSAPIINNILGLAFGMAYNASLDYLYNQDFRIDGYSNNTVYLRDVRDMGYIWDDGILSYDDFRRLYSIQLISSEGYDSPSRFYSIYDDLCRQYGEPIDTRGRSRFEGTWFGGDGNSYITLQYSRNHINGRQRYYTTITYSY